MTIEELRTSIDKLDNSIIDSLMQRFNISKEIGELKRKSNIPIEDNVRENYILSKINKSCDCLLSEKISEIYKLIFELSKEYQKK